MSRLFSIFLTLAVSICARSAEVADPGSFLGINCGKSGAHDTKQGMTKYFLKRNIATLNLAKPLTEKPSVWNRTAFFMSNSSENQRMIL